MPPSNLTIAVLIIPPIQLLDLSPIDLFHMLSKQYLRGCKLPSPFIALGLDSVTIHYVGADGPSSPSTTTTAPQPPIILAEATADISLRLTHNLTHPAVQPHAIDILFVPGPDPSLRPSDPVKAFIQSHAHAGTTIISVCTGIIPLAASGVLDGREATGPRALLGMFLREEFPRVEWVEKRWMVDEGRGGEGKGQLWTAGGITNGLDMVARYIRVNFQRELTDLVCGMAEVVERGQEYETGKVKMGAWFAWLLLRSWVVGVFGERSSGTAAAAKEADGRKGS